MLAFAVLCSGCWGDELPSLDQIGAIRSPEVRIRFESCPGERVERVVLNRTDDDFTEVEEVLWEIRLDERSDETSYVVGDAGEANEVIALEEPLASRDPSKPWSRAASGARSR